MSLLLPVDTSPAQLPSHLLTLPAFPMDTVPSQLLSVLSALLSPFLRMPDLFSIRQILQVRVDWNDKRKSHRMGSIHLSS
ncbi:hypothetical protein EVA_15897 [gut metagenome]|uniref:Uncharacterized protein n=1 Tax=gut metagenome TaxID=749906 RepID=J9FM55_9ZZZZ